MSDLWTILYYLLVFICGVFVIRSFRMSEVFHKREEKRKSQYYFEQRMRLARMNEREIAKRRRERYS